LLNLSVPVSLSVEDVLEKLVHLALPAVERLSVAPLLRCGSPAAVLIP
jgi:hypothetical protein